jgi:hypothetical protein
MRFCEAKRITISATILKEAIETTISIAPFLRVLTT